MRALTDEELAEKRQDAASRELVRKLFSQVPEARADAIDALKRAWGYDEPSFRDDELAVGAQAASLAAARRDGQKQIIAWLTRV